MLGPSFRFARVALTFFAALGCVSALNFKISPKEELCFHEITHKGNKVLAFFDVLSWGYGAYVYLDVTAPTGRSIQKFEAESEGRVEFIASDDGEHSFCFKNAYTETEVSFWVNTETDIALADVAKAEHVDDIVYSVEKLSSLVSAARVDLEAFKAREHIHRRSKCSLSFVELDPPGSFNIIALEANIVADNVAFFHSRSAPCRPPFEAAERNRRRVTFWALVECLLIISVAAVQVMRIKNFFEYKRSM